MPPTSGSPSGTPQSQDGPRRRPRRVTPYDAAFAVHLVDHGVFPCGYNTGDESAPVVPNNLQEMMDMLALERASTITEGEFRSFVRNNNQAATEAKIMSTAFQAIVGTSDIPNQQDVKFGHLAPLTLANLQFAQPGFYDGCALTDLRKPIREQLSSYIVPSTDVSTLMLPNFFAEVRDPDRPDRVNSLQACYDAALGARAIHELRSYVNPSTAADGNAYTISATYSGGGGPGLLTLYATHAVKSGQTDEAIEYHMTQLGSYAMSNSVASFRQGATAIRNARDWAARKRASLVAAANAKASTSAPQPDSAPAGQSTADTRQGGSSADQVAQNRASSTRSVSVPQRPETPSAENTRRRHTAH